MQASELYLLESRRIAKNNKSSKSNVANIISKNLSSRDQNKLIGDIKENIIKNKLGHQKL
jgi:hypothetical protein